MYFEGTKYGIIYMIIMMYFEYVLFWGGVNIYVVLRIIDENDDSLP